jgi:hypothetical protein
VRENSKGLHQPEDSGELQKHYSSDFPELLNVPTLDDDPSIELDVMQQSRKKNASQFVGCFIPSEKIEMKPYATLENTGPAYLHMVY